MESPIGAELRQQLLIASVAFGPVLTSPAWLRYIATVTAQFRIGAGEQAPVPPEKRFLINLTPSDNHCERKEPTMKTVTLRAKEIPVVKEVDVLVAGGGYAGWGAAMCAARNGANTMLVEQQSALGGLVTMGYVALKFSYVEGVAYELFHLLKQSNALTGRFVDTEKTKVALEQMLLKEKVSILYNTTVVDSIVEQDAITGVVIFNKSGLQAIKAKRVIDASGDGDISAFAGVPFEVGCPELDGYNQATSLVMRVGNVDMEEYSSAKDMATLWLEEIEKAVANGEYPYMIDKRVNWVVKVPGRDKKHQELFICYAHSRNCRCLDAEDLTRQLIEQRQQCQWIMEFCRKHLPGFKGAWLIDTAPMLGVRDSRRIMCEYRLTGDDLVNGARFEDAIMRGMHTFDAHHPTKVGHIKHIVRKNEKGENEKYYVNPGNWREMPYRSLVTRKIENLLVAGRNFSGDFMAQSGNRLVLECLNMGQAAGTAAALSIKDDVTPRKLDVKRLRQRLVEMGINLYHDPSYAQGAVKVGVKVKPEDLVFPEYNPSGQATTSLRNEKRAEYCVDTVKIDEENMRKYLQSVAVGYTDTGGDVGTNLE